MMKKIVKQFGIITLSIFLLTACNSDDDIIINPNQRAFGIFKVLEGDTTIEMNGTIKNSSLKNFNTLHKAFPKINTIQIKECDGSSDDETNLKLSKRVNQLKIDIHLLDNGLIASGGVDFFLAGIKRTKGKNTKIGVHSWSNDDGSIQATDFPVGHANHLPYINYYKSIGFTQQKAESFYYFTINAARAESIHYMTASEITTYEILKS